MPLPDSLLSSSVFLFKASDCFYSFGLVAKGNPGGFAAFPAVGGGSASLFDRPPGGAF